MSDDEAIEVRFDEARERYEIFVDGSVAGHLAVKERPNAVVLVHTETDRSMQGRGLASTLVRAALDDLRGRGKRVVVQCPYVRSFIDEHPEYADLELEGSR